MKNYLKVDLMVGTNLESAVNELLSYKEKSVLASGEFNGVMLYSDVDDMDSAFKKVTGKTKAEFDAYVKKRHDEYEDQKRKHNEAIPELEKQWIEKGEKILDEKYLADWRKCVPIRLSDLYQGMELGHCLDIVSELNAGCTLDRAKEIMESQGHSGMSFGLVCSMVKSFCERGAEFVAYVK